MLSLFKAIGAPGSVPFLALCLAAGLIVIYLWPRNRALGRTWLLGVWCGYVLLSLPWIANTIANRLPPLAAQSARRPLDVLIVLDGDNWLGRVRQAGEAFSVASPRVVWLLGDAGLLDSLQEAGIPRTRIVHASGEPTTRDQMTRVRALMAVEQPGPSAVIASRLQMPRVAALAQALDLHVALIPSPLDREPPTSGAWRFIPTYTALRVSQDALYEHAALAYYRWHGWIS
jgi:uncharacterized SAM-binding protein YcdF (DUF218 family)